MVQPGERLGSLVARSEEGTEVWLAWYDRALGFQCDTLPDVTGRIRCFPERDLDDVRLDLFADPECTVELVEAPRSNEDAWGDALFLKGIVVDRRFGAHWVAYRPNLPHDGAVFRRTDDGCTSASRWEGEPAWTIEPLDPSVLVAMTETVVVDDEQIRARVEEGSDGSRRVLGGWDADLGIAAEPGVASDGVLRWLPRRQDAVESDLFVDPGCSIPLSRGETEFVYRFHECEGHVDFHRKTGAKLVAPRFLWSWDDGVCKGDLLEDSLVVYETVAVDPEVFATVDAIVDDRAERLTSGWWGVGEQALTAQSQWLRGGGGSERHFDRDLGLSCEFVATSDDQYRCLPRFSIQTDLYWDSDCKESAVQTSSCRFDEWYAARLDSEGNVKSIHALGAAVEGPLYERDHDDCEPIRSYSGSHRMLGEEVPLSRFVSAEPVLVSR